MEREISGLKFVNEGSYAPEQYDVFDDIGIIAYVRYRYGKLWVEYPWVNGEEIIRLISARKATKEEKEEYFNER